MSVTGFWVGSRIEEGVTQRAGASAALYMESFVEPMVQDLAITGELSPAYVERLGRLLIDTNLGNRVLSFKIWQSNGRVIASSRADVVGQTFPVTAGLATAFRGVVKAEFDHLTEVENQFEHRLGIPILEVYIPLRAPGSDRVIAVGEFYERANELKTEMKRARLLSWLVVAAVTLSMLSALFGIVHRGSRTIEMQHAALEQRVGELTDLLAENRQLRERARQAAARASETNEGLLRRVGADLHDGPAQLISAVLLRFGAGAGKEPSADPVQLAKDRARQTQNTDYVRAVLGEALKDIRNLSAGLAVPEIDELPLCKALRHAVDRHKAVTGTDVAVAIGPLPDVPGSVKLCAYRFIQEGLTNAFRHAGGVGQAVAAATVDGDVIVTVTDAGSGRPPPADGSGGFGLRALADRVESIGGTLWIERCPSSGTRLTAQLPVFTADEERHGDVS
jgi:signal transduction histidine kinase